MSNISVIHHSRIKSFLGFCGLFSILSCGVPQPIPKQKISGSVDLPPFPIPKDDPETPGNFALAEVDGTQIYDGRLIFWDERATPQAIERVNRATVEGRQNKASALLYAQNEVVPAKQSFLEAQKEVTHRQAILLQAEQKGLRDPDILAKARVEFAQWMEQTLSRLEQTDTFIKNSRGLIEQRWRAYCDGKLWELATSAQALSRQTQRPSPQAMCESYYLSQGYFQNQATCSPNPQGQSYFHCLWSDGVLKTPQWRAVTEDPTTAQCALTQKVKKEVMKQWLEVEVQGVGTSPLEKLLADESTRQLFAEAVMSGGRFSKAVFSSKAMELFSQCPTALEKKGGLDTPKLDRASPQRLLWIVEHTFPGDLTSKEPLVPLRGDASRKEDQDLFNQLTAVVKQFGVRFTQTEGLRVSVNDVLFNTPVEGPFKNQSQKNEEGETLESAWSAIFPKDLSKADPIIKDLLANQSAQSEPLAQALNEAQKSLDVKQQVLDTKKQSLSQLLDLEQGSTTAGLKAVNKLMTTVYFSTFRLKLTKQDKIMFVELALDEPMTQCVVVSEGGRCPEPASSAAFNVENSADPNPIPPQVQRSGVITFDPKSNLLSWDIPLDNPSQVGFKPMPRTLEDLQQGSQSPLLRFNDVGELVWKNRVLHLEFYGAKLEGVLDFFGGNAFLKEGETKILQGSLTGDRFDQIYRLIEK